MRKTLRPNGLHALAVLAFFVGTLNASPAHAGKPFQVQVDFEIAAGQTSQCQALTVPANNRLTVSFASVLLQATSNGQQISGVILYTSISGQAESFNVIPVTALISSSTFQGAQVLTAYADPGSNPRICVSRSPVFTTGVVDVYGTVSGSLDAL